MSAYEVWLPEVLLVVLSILCTYLFVILPSASLVSFVGRKLGADFQARIGPNRSGFGGFFQPLADCIKLLQKDSFPIWKNKKAEFWFYVRTVALFSTVAVLPLSSLSLLVDTDLSVFIPIWVLFVFSLATLLMGFEENAFSSWVSVTRIISQAFAAAFPIFLTILTVGTRVGAFRWSVVADSQGFSPLHWNAIRSPFQLLAFLVFVTSGLIFLNINPANSATESSEIHGGFSAPLSGSKQVLYRLSSFYTFFLWSVIASVLFLGAWKIPQGFAENLKDTDHLHILHFFEVCMILAKSFLIMLSVIWIQKVNPRARVDQVTDFSWRVLSPLAIVSLLGASICTGLRALM